MSLGVHLQSAKFASAFCAPFFFFNGRGPIEDDRYGADPGDKKRAWWYLGLLRDKSIARLCYPGTESDSDSNSDFGSGK